jgi:ABC-type polysaccharide/polyol phosphate transport system ATPase subunit
MTTLVLKNVSVDFPIYGSRRSLRKALFSRAIGGFVQRGDRHHHDRLVVKALNDVSLELKDGDRLALIGHNGSGKSTMLKVMAGIYEPIAGRVEVSGHITPLFDTLPGIDGEDTGYENLITAGLLLGMSRSQIEARISDVEEFSELGEFLELPVRTYSAGMTTRLGFSLATAIDPGILLIDEGIGAGDARFFERAQKRMFGLVDRSPIMVLASHSMEMLRTMCNKAALLNGGQILATGPVSEIVDQYHMLMLGKLPTREPKRRPDPSPSEERR